jgi:hypothetical protein
MDKLHSSAIINNQMPEGVKLKTKMSKVTLKFTSSVDVEMSIPVPYYCRSLSGVHYYCIYDEHNAISATVYGISQVSPSVAFAGGHVEISPSQFAERHAMAVETIISNFSVAKTKEQLSLVPVIESDGTEVAI